MIYVVTRGTYSDKHNVAVCSTLEKAEALVAKIKECHPTGWCSDEVDFEEYDLDILADNLDIQWWDITLDVEGNTINARQCKMPLFGGGGISHFAANDNFQTYVATDSMPHAIKVAGERRFRLLAENQQ